jgi:hypothetical protein
MPNRLGGDQSDEEHGDDGDERNHPQQGAQRGKADVAVGFTIASGLVGRDVCLLELAFGSLSEVNGTPASSCVVAWILTLARMAEPSCTPLMSPVVRLAMRTAPTRRAQRGTSLVTVFGRPPTSALSRSGTAKGDRPIGDGDDCGARAGARRQPRR